jgi:transposase
MTTIIKDNEVYVEDYLSMNDIDELISDCNIYVRLYKRLLVIKMLKKGFNIDDAAEFINVTPRTVYNWLKNYNEKGLDGLIPNFGGGRPAYLTNEELSELNIILSDENANYTIEQVRKIIRDKFGVEYSYKQTWFITRKKLGLNYGKPSPPLSLIDH